MAQTPAISVRLCCHAAYGTRQTVSLFPSCLCLLRDDRSKSTFRPSSRHQEDLAVIWGEKGWKAEHLAVASGDASAWLGVGGPRSSCGGQRSGCDCEETANWSNCGGKTWGLLSGSCQCLSGLQLVTGASRVWANLFGGSGGVQALRGKTVLCVLVCVCV